MWITDPWSSMVAAPVLRVMAILATLGLAGGAVLANAGFPERIGRFSVRWFYWIFLWTLAMPFCWIVIAELYRTSERP